MSRIATTTAQDAALPQGDELSDAYRSVCVELEKHKATVINQQAHIAVLEEKLRDKTIEKYAASSESNPLQSRLFNDVEQAADERAGDQEATPAGTSKKKPNKRKGLNPDINRVQQFINLTDEQRARAKDTFFVMVKEELDITPSKVQVIQWMQEKAVYHDEDGKRVVEAASRPPHPLGKSIASVSLLTYLIIAKYCDGMPLYRLEGILKRYGGSINRSTMASWLIRLAQQLQCVVNLLQEVQLTADYLQGDETRQQVLKEHGTDPTGDKWIWVIRGGPPDKPVVFFHYNKSRGGDVARELLDGFTGRYYQCDSYAGQKMAVGDKKVTVIGCMDHARRKFVKVEKALTSACPKTVNRLI